MVAKGIDLLEILGVPISSNKGNVSRGSLSSLDFFYSYSLAGRASYL
jgi:hypothetical protein